MTRRILTLLLCAFTCAAGTIPARAAGEAPAAGARGGYSIKDSPGYVPLADPESLAVKLGRRPGAPLVAMPFTGGGKSLDDLGRQICRIMENTPTLDSLMALTVTEGEFDGILWPEFPQSRPATGLSAGDGWKVLYPRLLNGCNSALIDYAGGYFQFVRFEVEKVTPFRNFTLYQGITLVARNGDGREERHPWIRAIAERKGRFKIYSVRD